MSAEITEQQRLHSRGPRFVLSPAVATQGLRGRRVEVDPREVVFIKSIVEASEGLASIFSHGSGSLVIASPPTRERALLELLADLEADHGVRVLWQDEVQ